jgi:NAD(P)-dependent dehydrogenase (short-subunit alcohol dehydrogenase family)
MSSNRAAVVTGGGNGIGKAIALALAREDTDVVVVDKAPNAARSTVREIKALGSKGLAINADVSIVSDVDRIFDRTLETFGKVDILVNNAGVTHPTVSILDVSLSDLEEVINTNFKGTYLCSRRGGKEMVSQKKGCIINISSAAGLEPPPLVVYAPMKSAVNMLTRILARDWARYGVRVNAIAPGYVLTPLIKGAIDKGLRDPSLLLKRIPMHTFIAPEDIAHAALFLASDKARYITGAIILVDAGFTSDGGWEAYPIGHES